MTTDQILAGIMFVSFPLFVAYIYEFIRLREKSMKRIDYERVENEILVLLSTRGGLRIDMISAGRNTAVAGEALLRLKAEGMVSESYSMGSPIYEATESGRLAAEAHAQKRGMGK